jgi:hypothetical protein
MGAQTVHESFNGGGRDEDAAPVSLGVQDAGGYHPPNGDRVLAQGGSGFLNSQAGFVCHAATVAFPFGKGQAEKIASRSRHNCLLCDVVRFGRSSGPAFGVLITPFLKDLCNLCRVTFKTADTFGKDGQDFNGASRFGHGVSLLPRSVRQSIRAMSSFRVFSDRTFWEDPRPPVGSSAGAV